MPESKPFYRTVRSVKEGPNSGYNGRAFIDDPEYANRPDHYTRALSLIIDDLKSLFEYIEPADECKLAYSYRIHSLFMRTCIEIEANFKAIFESNLMSNATSRSLGMRDYRKIDVTHHLSSYEVVLPMWNGASPAIRPFEPWLTYRGQPVPQGVPLPWYQAYNASKHDRQQEFKKANFWNLIQAAAALLIVVSSQFKDATFDSSPDFLWVGNGHHRPYEISIGSLFMIKYPEDWSNDEIYDFDWAVLKEVPDRFQKFNYDAILV